jgi:hypothetical protein
MWLEDQQDSTHQELLKLSDVTALFLFLPSSPFPQKADPK